MIRKKSILATVLTVVSLTTSLNITSFADTSIIDTNSEISSVKKYVSNSKDTNIIIDETETETEAEKTDIAVETVEEVETTEGTSDVLAEQAEVEVEVPAVDVRSRVAELAKSYAGVGTYRYGGNNPLTGVDCSGFSKFVLQNAAGISLNRSSGSQIAQGSNVPSINEARPGDLIFYAKGGRVNHVAVYIGDGRVVSASSKATGIRVTAWNYRPPVAIKNVIG